MKFLLGLMAIVAGFFGVWKSTMLIIEGSTATESIVLYIVTSIFIIMLHQTRSNGKNSNEESTLPKPQV